ncbi:antiviral reverse transcriptase Drt3b [Pectobacterium polaris]|uniref:antiviral reverse transcriptase Drt3b n=1 Tax=Pectobacterium polaris TaxID=2042057 RepID=UPI0032E384AE
MPIRIASTYYYKNLLEDRNLYKSGSVDMEQDELLSRHASSYFGYHGYDRLYKFFTSSEFLKLESKFNTLYTLDVSKCFDSIYTHSISWATKDKLYTKGMLSKSSLNFGDAFDKLMQRCNFNETHGLIIGPEVSRIFAEIIFQKIDLNVERKLSTLSCPLINRCDYEIRRYVDDVFIFTKNEVDAEEIYKIYSDKLNEYNMHINKNKVTKNIRPFLTSKSKVIHAVNERMNAFIDLFLETNNDLKLIPKVIYNKNKLAGKFIDEVKIICVENSVEYGEVSSYIISSIFERIKRLTVDKECCEEKDIFNAVCVLLSVAFFFFMVSPSVSASYKLASILIVSLRYVKKIIPEYSEFIESYVYQEIIDFLSELSKSKSEIEGFVNLEAYNLMYVIGDLSEERYLPVKLIESVFGEINNYYDIISCLYLIKNNIVYNSLKKKVNDNLHKIFLSADDILDYTEKAILFLDVMSCPYIELKNKRLCIRKVYRNQNKTIKN